MRNVQTLSMQIIKIIKINKIKSHGIPWHSMEFHPGCHIIPLKCHGNSIETMETMAISETGNHANAKENAKEQNAYFLQI